jgi:cell wall-associated NlpC family hydrolase
VNKNQVVQYSLEDLSLWAETKKIQSRYRIAYIFKTRSNASESIRELIMGVQLPVSEKRDGWVKVTLPDQEYGWCRIDDVQDVIGGERRFNSRILIKTAKSFLGIPYLWGGRSIKAFDCSGFVQTSFHFHGLELPRDASLQWRCGECIGKDYKKFIKGDLLFFSLDGKKITHVAISLGRDGRYIHASGYIRCNSLNPAHRIYSKERAITFIGARRVGMPG